MTDVIARDDEVGTVICDAAYHEMHMRVVGVPMGDADPVQPGAEVTLHLADQVTGECLDVGHLGGILRRDDEVEMMPVVEAASREGRGVRAVLGSAKHAALLAVHPGLDDYATVGGEQTAAAECGPASPERRTTAPRTTPPSGRRTWFDARLPRGAQNLVDEALAAVSIADAPQHNLEFVVVAAHGVSGISVWLVPKRALKNRAFCLRVALPTDRLPAES
jgi:hypothetical protein